MKSLPGFLSIQDCVLAILAKLQHLSILTFLAAQPQVVRPFPPGQDDGDGDVGPVVQ